MFTLTPWQQLNFLFVNLFPEICALLPCHLSLSRVAIGYSIYCLGLVAFNMALWEMLVRFRFCPGRKAKRKKEDVVDISLRSIVI